MSSILFSNRVDRLRLKRRGRLSLVLATLLLLSSGMVGGTTPYDMRIRTVTVDLYSVEIDGMIAVRQRWRSDTAIEDPKWSRLPDLARLRTLHPNSLERDVEADVKCRLGAAGVLRDCRVTEIRPDREGFKRAARALSEELVLDPAQVEQLRPRIEWIGVSLRIRNRLGVPNRTPPCLLPGCNITPPPPPPPPR